MTKLEKSTAKDAYSGFLARRGFEVLGDWDCEIGDFGLVAKDEDGAYRFTCCFFPTEGIEGFEDVEDFSCASDARHACEKAMLAWAFENDVDFADDQAICFDAIHAVVFPSGDRAILRHHKSCFSK